MNKFTLPKSKNFKEKIFQLIEIMLDNGNYDLKSSSLYQRKERDLKLAALYR